MSSPSFCGEQPIILTIALFEGPHGAPLAKNLIGCNLFLETSLTSLLRLGYRVTRVSVEHQPQSLQSPCNNYLGFQCPWPRAPLSKISLSAYFFHFLNTQSLLFPSVKVKVHLCTQWLDFKSISTREVIASEKITSPRLKASSWPNIKTSKSVLKTKISAAAVLNVSQVFGL